jgi:hypothetical protein
MDAQNVENAFEWPCDIILTSHHQYQQSRMLRHSEANYEIAGPFANLNITSEFNKVAFSDSKN